MYNVSISYDSDGYTKWNCSWTCRVEGIYKKMNPIPIEKNKEYIVKIIDNGFEGEGIQRWITSPSLYLERLKGEIEKILIAKVLTSHAFWKDSSEC